MDHSGMDHGGMDHGGMDHGDMGGAMCSMDMLFTWNTNNLCIVFQSWRVVGPISLFFTLLAIILICAGYEALRELTRRYEHAVARRSSTAPRRNQQEVSRRAHVVKAALYASQNFYAFMIMLFFMTYNGWVMLAVTLGSFLGYIVFGSTTNATKDNACH